MRGIIAGKSDVIVDATPNVNPSAQPAFAIDQGGSHTLQNRDFDDSEALRARLIEATVKAIADGNNPRLSRSRS